MPQTFSRKSGWSTKTRSTPFLKQWKKANRGGGLAEIDLGLKFSVPGVEVLVIPGGDGHDAVACFGKRPGKSIAHGAEAACD